jgi:hypothetical protein
MTQEPSPLASPSTANEELETRQTLDPLCRLDFARSKLKADVVGPWNDVSLAVERRLTGRWGPDYSVVC